MEEFDELNFVQVVGMAVHAAGMELSTLTPVASNTPSVAGSSERPSISGSIEGKLEGKSENGDNGTVPDNNNGALPDTGTVSGTLNISGVISEHEYQKLHRMLVRKWSHLQTFLQKGGALRRGEDGLAFEYSDAHEILGDSPENSLGNSSPSFSPLKSSRPKMMGSGKIRARQRQSHVYSRHMSLLLLHCAHKGKLHNLSNLHQSIKRTFPSTKCNVGGLHTYARPIINRVRQEKLMTNANLAIQRKNEEMRKIKEKFELSKREHRQFSKNVLKSGKEGILLHEEYDLY